MNSRRYFRKRRRRKTIALQETYLDKTLAGDIFSLEHGEGRLYHTLQKGGVIALTSFFFLVLLLVFFRIAYLQVIEGDYYRDISENNTFTEKIVFAERGKIFDRNGEALAWNMGSSVAGEEISLRHYPGEGFGSLLGFVKYPQKDASGNYYHYNVTGASGIEKLYDGKLTGGNGSLVIEEDALGKQISELYINQPRNGGDVVLSVDGKVQNLLYQTIKEVAQERNFEAGSAVLLNAHNGEILSLVSYPDFDNNILTNQSQEQRATLLDGDEEGVFVNRSISGLYIPGSTVKPFFAVAALEEEVIEPNDVIVSSGSITVKNPYDAAIEYVFRDWRAHGPLNLYEAIAWSSNVYFYTIGGGHGHIQDALGIDRLHAYADMFGFGRPTAVGSFNEPSGVVPNPEWKENLFGTSWRLGDTYNTVIGQYAFQVTPLQLARALVPIANDGNFFEPHFDLNVQQRPAKLAVDMKHIEVVKIGMRKTVLEGTATSLNSPDYNLAVKTGTAQLGGERMVNSLVIGFFPYQNPEYVFVIVMERGLQGGGAISATRQFFERLFAEAPEYFTG